MKTVIAVIAVIVLFLSLILFLIKRALSPDKMRREGIFLRRKFDSLGDMKGMSKEDIIAVVGNLSSVIDIGNSQILLWSEIGFHITISFRKDGVFEYVTHKAIDERI